MVGDDKNIFVKGLINNQEAPNILFLMTPLTTVDDELATKFYKPLYNEGVNVFALDLPGIGKSKKCKFTYSKIQHAIKETVSFINENYTDEIHLYGGTGTGGIFAQAIASDKELSFFKTFSQFGIINYKDLSPLGNNLVFKFLYPMIKLGAILFPRYEISFEPPEYNGYNAEKENLYYKNLMKEYPDAFNLPLSVISTIMWLALSKNSPLQNVQEIPTLVMATEHDRYFSKKYVRKYFDSIKIKKELQWINDSHCVYDWGAELLAKKVVGWIEENK